MTPVFQHFQQRPLPPRFHPSPARRRLFHQPPCSRSAQRANAALFHPAASGSLRLLLHLPCSLPLRFRSPPRSAPPINVPMRRCPQRSLPRDRSLPQPRSVLPPHTCPLPPAI